MQNDKTIRGYTASEIIEKMHDVARWLDVFCDAGEYIYGDEFDVTLAIVGLAVSGLVSPMERLADLGDKKAKEYRKGQDDDSINEMLKQLNIKKEGNDTLPN